MSTVTTSEGWMTNYIYEQDLTSAYMNSSLYSLFRPGIYNANIYVSYSNYDSTNKNTPNTSNDGLDLIIKKGTTFVFSNDYINYKSLLGNKYDAYRRSFTCESLTDDNPGQTIGLLDSRFPLIIKCVAMTDIVIKGIARAAIEGCEDRSCQPWDENIETIPPESLYLCAHIKYDQKDGGDNKSTPDFSLFRNNPYYATKSLEDDTSKFFYTGTLVGNQLKESYDKEEVYWGLPDGSSTYRSHLNSMMQYNYLMIGVFADAYIHPEDSDPKIYKSFEEEWFKNHTFTARCLPEYRYPMIGNFNNPSPDFIIPLKSYKSDGEESTAPKFSRLYIDFKNVINLGNIYNTSIDWESAYGIADTNSGSFIRIDHLRGKKGKDYISYALSDDEKRDIAGDIVDPDTTETTIKRSSLVLDFTYALSKNVLNDDNNLDNGEDIITQDNINPNSVLGENKIRIYNHREIIEVFDDSSTIIKDLEMSNTIMKLDISKSNTNRLLEFIKNKDILYRIIGKMRASGEINPDEGESIVPVALAFRVLKKVGSKIEGQCNDNITSADSVNPINVLSLLDLEYKMTKLNSISNMSRDAFTILPVIE